MRKKLRMFGPSPMYLYINTLYISIPAPSLPGHHLRHLSLQKPPQETCWKVLIVIVYGCFRLVAHECVGSLPPVSAMWIYLNMRKVQKTFRRVSCFSCNDQSFTPFTPLQSFQKCFAMKIAFSVSPVCLQVARASLLVARALLLVTRALLHITTIVARSY